MKPTPKDILELAQADPRFTRLVRLIHAAGLEAQVKGRGPFTLFAPGDEAFEKLPAGEFDALLADRKGAGRLVNYHLLNGALRTFDLPDGRARTLEGASIAISATDDGMRVDGANVTMLNLAASNGVIHMIDTVLHPERPAPGAEAPSAQSPWSGQRRPPPPPRPQFKVR